MANENLVVGIGADVSDLIKGTEISAAALNKFAGQVDRLAKELPNISPQDFMGGVSDGLRDAARDLQAVQSQAKTTTSATNQIARGFEATSRTAAQSITKLRSGLAQVAVQAAGTSGAVGQIGQSLAFAFGGNTAIIAVSALIIAYQQLTKTVREATEAREKLSDALGRRIEAALPASTQISHEVAAAEERRALIARELLNVEKERRSVIDGFVFELANEYRLKKLTKDLSEEQRKVDEGLLLLQKQLNKERQQGAAQLLAGLGIDIISQGDPIAAAEASRRLTIANAELTDSERAAALAMSDTLTLMARRAKATKELVDREKEIARFNQQLQRTGQGAEGESRKVAIDWWEKNQKAIKATQDALDQYRQTASAAIPSIDELIQAHIQWIDATRASWLAVTDSIAGVVQTARAVGAIGDQAANALLSVLDLVDAIKEITLTGAGLANVFGLIGAGIGVLGTIGQSVFGSDATQREHAAILSRNNDALADATAAIRDWNDSIEAARGAQANIGAIDPAVLRGIESLAGGSGQFGELGTNILDQQLRQLGSSLAELDAIAQANGIQLLDEKGRLVAGALDQLIEKLKLAEQAEEKRAEQEAEDKAAEEAADKARDLAQAAEDAAREAARLAEEMARARIAAGEQVRGLSDLRNQLLGITDPLETFKDHMIALGVGSADTAAFFGAIGPINVDTPALREALKQRILDWIEQAQSGALNPEDLGLTQDQFNQLLQDSVQFLNDFNASMEAAASAAREEARRVGDLRSRILGDDDPMAHFQRELGILGDAIPGLSDMFRDLDPDSLQEELLRALDSLGDVDPKLRDEFLNLLGLGADALDTFTSAADQATKSLQNLPKGLNLAEYEWRTRMALPGRPGDGASLPQFGSPIISPTMPASQATSAGSSVAINGPVTIQLHDVGTKSPDELAREIIAALKRLGMGRTGSPFDFG